MAPFISTTKFPLFLTLQPSSLTLAEIALQRYPFASSSNSTFEVLDAIAKGLLTPLPDHFSEECKAFVAEW